MTKSRTLLLVLAGAIVAVVVAVMSAQPSNTAAAPAATAVPATKSTAPALAAAPKASAAELAPTAVEVGGAGIDTEAATDVLVAGLDSEDPVVVAEAANALVGRAAVDVLPVLVDANVLARPKAAPSLIYAMGKLAAKAAPADRAATVDRLLALMAEEKQRGAQESQGNLLQIYEALGDTGDARAIAALERELLDPAVPTAPKVVVVQALVALRATSSRPALEKVAAQLASTTATGLEAELQRDLLAVIREALVQLS